MVMVHLPRSESAEQLHTDEIFFRSPASKCFKVRKWVYIGRLLKIVLTFLIQRFRFRFRVRVEVFRMSMQVAAGPKGISIEPIGLAIKHQRDYPTHKRMMEYKFYTAIVFVARGSRIIQVRREVVDNPCGLAYDRAFHAS